MELTKDADKVLCVIYKEYLEKRKSGVDKSSAKCFVFDFPDSKQVKMKHVDISETVCELSRLDMVTLYIDGGYKLTDAAIVYMEN